MNALELFSGDDATRLEQALRVRFAVFVDEQHVPAQEEIDRYDRATTTVHALLCADDGTPVGTGRWFRDDDGAAHIGRMAVAASHRGTGVGARLLDGLMNDARESGCAKVRLSAQTHACGFYERAGFASYGDPFMDAGIPHVSMERPL